jgi:hypothetical protein
VCTPLLPLLLAAVVAGGAAGAVEARPVATAPNDAAMEKLERIVRARVTSVELKVRRLYSKQVWRDDRLTLNATWPS